MLSLVTAAEHQYRFESARLDRDAALRSSIREHLAARAASAWAPRDVAPRPRRATMALPFGGGALSDPVCAAC
ncbi:hypothetical protein [Microbacterium sp.]|uniref:hypothetical protein n=1 Tax=Microbacterium sp. TaxID=51671 RepID=UPI003F72771E